MYVFDLEGVQLAKLLAPDGEAHDRFGASCLSQCASTDARGWPPGGRCSVCSVLRTGVSVAIANTRIVAGAYQNSNEKGSNAGTAYVLPRWCLNGIQSHSGMTCCAHSCGRCGGDGCAYLPGGRSECCISGVRDSGVTCAHPEDSSCRLPAFLHHKVSDHQSADLVEASGAS